MAKSLLRSVNDHGVVYPALLFVCPGCASDGSSGLHMLPVNTEAKSPAWTFNGNLEMPTLSPSILSKSGNAQGPTVCHCYLVDGVFRFLTDSTHALSGQHVAMPDLPDWVLDEE